MLDRLREVVLGKVWKVMLGLLCPRCRSLWCWARRVGDAGLAAHGLGGGVGQAQGGGTGQGVEGDAGLAAHGAVHSGAGLAY